MKRSRLGIYQYSPLVGGIVLVCVALFMGALLNAGLLKEWFQTSLTLRILLPETGVSGLAHGTEVQVMGTRAGEIRRIVIDPSQRMHAEARIERQMRPFIRRDSQVFIRRQFGIAGNAYLEISRGTGQELDWAFAVLSVVNERAPTDTIGAMIEEVHARVIPLLDELQKVAGNINALLVPLQQTVKSGAVVAGRLERGEGPAGRMLADDRMAADLQATFAAAQQAMAHANNVMAELERSSKDSRIPVLIQRTEAVLASLQTVTRSLATASPQFGQLTQNVTSTTESMPALMLQTQTTAHELELLLGQLRRSWLLGGGGAAPPAGRRAPASEVRP